MLFNSSEDDCLLGGGHPRMTAFVVRSFFGRSIQSRYGRSRRYRCPGAAVATGPAGRPRSCSYRGGPFWPVV